MKTIKKLCCVLLVFAVVMSLGVTAFAENKYVCPSRFRGQ